MSEEIKDILEHLSATQKINNGWKSFYNKECKLLYNYITNLQQKENIIKEVREYIEKYDFITGYYEHNYDDENDTYTHYTVKEELLEILDKENK